MVLSSGATGVRAASTLGGHSGSAVSCSGVGSASTASGVGGKFVISLPGVRALPGDAIVATALGDFCGIAGASFSSTVPIGVPVGIGVSSLIFSVLFERCEWCGV